MALQNVYEVGVGKQFSTITTAYEQLYVDSGGTYYDDPIPSRRKGDGSLLGKFPVTILLYPGTYTDEYITLNGIAVDAVNFITIEGVDRYSVIWSPRDGFGGSCAEQYFTSKNFTWTNRPYWNIGAHDNVFDGIYFKDGNQQAYSAQGTIFKNCEFSGYVSILLSTQNANKPCIAENCWAHDCIVGPFSAQGTDGQVSSKIIVRNCYFYNCSGTTAIQAGACAFPLNCYIYNNVFDECNVGVNPFGGTDTVYIYNNSFRNCNTGVSVNYLTNTNITIKNNLFFSTAVGAGQGAILFVDSGGMGGFVCDNNIEYSNAPNIYHWNTTYYTNFADWKTASGQDANSIFADPLIVGTGSKADACKLQHRSPARRIGADLSAIFTTDYYGVTREFPWAVGAIVASGEVVGGRNKIGRGV